MSQLFSHSRLSSTTPVLLPHSRIHQRKNISQNLLSINLICKICFKLKLSFVKIYIVHLSDTKICYLRVQVNVMDALNVLIGYHKFGWYNGNLKFVEHCEESLIEIRFCRLVVIQTKLCENPGTNNR